MKKICPECGEQLAYVPNEHPIINKNMKLVFYGTYQCVSCDYVKKLARKIPKKLAESR